MSWYLVIRRMQETPDGWKDLVEDHLTWMRSLHEDGSVIMSGPSTDLRLGIYVMRAQDASKARAVALRDPLLRSGGASVEIIEWQLHQVLGVGVFEENALDLRLAD